MNSDDDVVITDPDVAVISDTRGIVDHSQNPNSIIVIDEDNTATDQNDDVIEIIDIENNNEQNRTTYSNTFERIAHENKPLSEFIEKCLDIEHSEGMFRVINRSLLGIYELLSDDYKISPEFRKLIHAKMRAMDMDPAHKFSHLKDMCETMKCHKKRKKVALTTLSTDIKDKHNNGSHLPAKRKKKSFDVIEIPTELEPDPVIDLDEEPNDVIILEDNQVIDKENIIESNVQENNNEKDINNKPELAEVPVIDENFRFNNDNHFLVPQRSKEVTTISEDMIINKVTYIENRIALYKKEIEKLELLEVDTDTVNSPYVRCERFKSEVVSMYKELCSLMGAEAVKKRVVRLQVTNGAQELPVKKLEKLINDNIGSDGNPHFPDFSEVVECVIQANIESNLGYTHAQISREAMRLFTTCGLALQQKRQKRDWKNMLGRVDYRLDDDPAESDPGLLAKLEENRQVGMKREEELLDTFVKLEYSRMNPKSRNNCNGGIQISQDQSNENENGEIESDVPLKHIEKDVTKHIYDTNSVSVATTDQINNQKVLNETNTYYVEQEDAIASISDIHSKCMISVKDVYYTEALNIPIGGETESNALSENIEKNVTKSMNDTNSEFVAGTSQINNQKVLNDKNEHQVEKEANVNISNTDGKSATRLNDVQNIEVLNITIIDQYGNSQEKNGTEEKIKETNVELVTGINIKKEDQSRTDTCQDDINQNVTSTVNNDQEIHTLVQNVKSEPRDILKDMAQFSDNFTATIIYIEDPYLIIEISSDSSDDESDSQKKTIKVVNHSDMK